ncbi:MAG TPA: MoaD/ThiS family protein [Marmoricola sp.]|nr:MoaD/ThiS family protein [Marmoricola sp.]
MVSSGQGVVTVRMWAGARAAAGTSEVVLDVPGPVSVAWVRDEVLRRLPFADGLEKVLSVCSVLVGETPVGTADPAGVEVAPGGSVEFLPPFAGG